MSSAPLALGADPPSRTLAWRRFADVAFQVVSLVVLLVALASLAALIWDIVADGAGRLSLDFITSVPSVATPPPTSARLFFTLALSRVTVLPL